MDLNHSQGGHLPGKPGKVREFQSGHGKVREKSGKLKFASLGPNNFDRS